jgi:hypothetical protein
MSKRIFFLIAAVVLLGTGLFYRAASAHMARKLADQIVADDLAAKDTTAARASLKDFAAVHMGAAVNFTLKGSYDRATATANAAATVADPNTQVYAAAQAACSGKTDSITQAKCNQAYLASHLVATPTPAPVVAPKLASYQYAVKSPLWSPDLAGALLLGSLAAFIIGFVINRPKGAR